MLNTALIDDGTLDTVIECWCLRCDEHWQERVGQDFAADYRDAETGEMIDLDGLVDDLDVCCECSL